jgi:hypothetical protein
VEPERRALAAFLVLTMGAIALAVVLRADTRAAAARPTGSVGPSGSRADAVDGSGPGTTAEPSSVCPAVPLYPTAQRVPQERDRLLLRAVNRVHDVPVVTRMERFSLGHEAWLGGGRLPDVFTFYVRRMEPIGFELMPAPVRREIGVRPSGEVDSPEVLYANPAGAALVQARPGGEMRLTLFCGPVEV